MMFQTLAVLSTLALVSSRETVRQMPAITNSLVNLGKMEVSFYLNHHPERVGEQESSIVASPSFYPKSEAVVEEPCPCSALRNPKDSTMSSPTNLFNKILTNNDLFSFNKEPISSSLCCESHEHVQEGTFVFEIPQQPPQQPSNPINSPTNFIPFLFDTMLPNFSGFPNANKQMSPQKKSIEILVLPNKNENKLFGDIPQFPAKKEKSVKADFKNIHVVGEKEWPNYNIEHFKPQPPPSIKKDLNAQEKNKNGENFADKEDKALIDPVSKTNSV